MASPRKKPSELRLYVEGFKSIRDGHDLEIRPLTLISGANSSGKSSFIKPLLLLKQTLDSSYDPGALLLDGHNARFTSMEQLLWSGKRKSEQADSFTVGLKVGEESLRWCFGTLRKRVVLHHIDSIQVAETESKRLVPGALVDVELRSPDLDGLPLVDGSGFEAAVVPSTSIVDDSPLADVRLKGLVVDVERLFPVLKAAGEDGAFKMNIPIHFRSPISTTLAGLIHIPALRGNPERMYPTTDVGGKFPGTFDHYVASVIDHWKRDAKGKEKLQTLNEWLRAMGLTWKVEAKRHNETTVELRVGRLASPQQGGAQDLVNIADVGFGVSQVLPLLVALLEAEPGRIIYIEQPEIHLHPRAQVALADILLEAAARRVFIIAETHSQLLLKAVQVRAAQDPKAGRLVKLHWFTRDEEGASQIRSADLDAKGAYGDWPQDFAEVELQVESDYLDAALGD